MSVVLLECEKFFILRGKKMYKVLAFDIDGTLTNSEKKITEKTKNAIFKAAEKGCKIVIATGRPVQGIVEYAKELKLRENGGYILAFNGGRIISCADDKIVSDRLVPVEYYKEIYELSKKHGVNLLTYEGDGVISENIDDEYLNVETSICHLDKIKVPNLLERLTFGVNKFLMTAEGSYLAEVEKDVYEKLHDRMDVYRSEPFFLEILPKNINKASALEELINILGCKREELMAFGDSYNDLTMIQYAGMGVAMGNAKDIVKENADFIAKTNDEDGIVDVINKFVLD